MADADGPTYGKLYSAWARVAERLHGVGQARGAVVRYRRLETAHPTSAIRWIAVAFLDPPEAGHAFAFAHLDDRGRFEEAFEWPDQ